MSSMQIDALLAQIRTMQSQLRAPLPNDTAGTIAAAGLPANGSTIDGPGGPGGFAQLLRSGLGQVNESQQRAATLAAQFEQGVPGVELPQVMLEMQKASVSFRAVTEVRNRFVNAYQEIMNMPL